MAFTGASLQPIRCDQRPGGFTLLELLVVLVIFAFLLTFALPGYRQHVLKGQRRLAAAHLQLLHMRQQQYIQEYRAPAVTLAQLGVPADLPAIDGRGHPAAPGAQRSTYLVELRSHGSGYLLVALPQHRQRRDVACGSLSLNGMGLKESSGAGSSAECW